MSSGKDASLSSSSEKNAKSSSSEKQSESGSSSAGKENCSALLDGEKGWNWDVPKECRFNPDIDYGTMTDERDGKVYKTVKIGNQTWMAENLNYADSVKTPSLLERSWCFNDDPQNCKVGGRLYTWAAAMDSVKTGCGDDSECIPTLPLQGLCPVGWHLPSQEEWGILLITVDIFSTLGELLKSQTGWYNNNNGLDDFGFSALPVGIRDDDGYYLYDGYYADFWSFFDDESSSSFAVRVGYDHHIVYQSGYEKQGFSVRCLKDGSGDVFSLSNVVTLVPSCKTKTEDNCEYGELTDKRDGKKYKTVKIGDQWWMAENLNYADSVKTPSLLEQSWCFENEPDSCSKYGRLYTWAAAIDSAKLYKDKSIECGDGKTCSLPDTVYGICPEGWHLPDTTEWNALFAIVGGKNYAGKFLKSQSSWSRSSLYGKGLDAFGFSALPAGRRYYEDRFLDNGIYADFWSATEYENNHAYGPNLYVAGYNVSLDYVYKGLAFAVRCIKN